MTLKDKFFSFEGRLRRRDWWLLGICLAVLQMVGVGLVTYLRLGPEQSILTSAAAWLTPPSFEAKLTMSLAGLLFAWPQLGLSVKRAHDRDKSARLVVIIIIASFALAWAPQSLVNPALVVPTTWWHAAAASAYSALSLCGTFYLFNRPGIPGRDTRTQSIWTIAESSRLRLKHRLRIELGMPGAPTTS
jgi:uncharacterized membrane protein YhaH (DUF805 family)